MYEKWVTKLIVRTFKVWEREGLFIILLFRLKKQDHTRYDYRYTRVGGNEAELIELCDSLM